jgi:hypothetical protein
MELWFQSLPSKHQQYTILIGQCEQCFVVPADFIAQQLIMTQLLKNFPELIEPEGPLPHSQSPSLEPILIRLNPVPVFQVNLYLSDPFCYFLPP